MTTFQGAYSQRNRYGNYTAVGGTNYHTIRAVPNNTTMGSVSVIPTPVTVSVGTAYAHNQNTKGATSTVTDHKVTTGTVTGYKSGMSVKITATARPGFHFVRWDGLPSFGNWPSCKTVNPLSFLAQCDLSLTAVFAADEPRFDEPPVKPEDPQEGGDDPERPGLTDIPSGDITGQGGGETPPAQEPQAAQGTGILALARRYWWIIAAVLVVYLITRNETE